MFFQASKGFDGEAAKLQKSPQPDAAFSISAVSVIFGSGGFSAAFRFYNTVC